MPYAGPFYFLSDTEGNVSLPSVKDKKANVAEYWSKRLGLDLTQPRTSSPPTFIHLDLELDPEVAHKRILNTALGTEESVDVVCPFCDEHLSIEAPFEKAYECPYCDSEFEYEANSPVVDVHHFDWYSADREHLLAALANNTGLDSYEVLDSCKGHRGTTMVANVFGTLFGLWFALGFAFFSGLGLLMLPLTLLAGSEVPLLLSLVFSIIGMFTFIPSVKFVFEILGDFFSPETLEKYTRNQYYDPVRKYTAWVEQITSSGLGRQGSMFVLSEAILGNAHLLCAYRVYYSVDSGHGGGGGG
jgi:uncharacterized Zn-finger protein